MDWNAGVVTGSQPTSQWIQGSGTVGTSAVQLSASSVPITWVIIQADPGNAASSYVIVGGSTVTNSGATQGPRLAAGASVQGVATNLNQVYVVADAAGRTYNYLAGVT